MAGLTIVWQQSAIKELAAIAKGNPALAHRLRRAIEALANGSAAGKSLTGNLIGVSSLRVGACRVIYDVLPGTIGVLKIAHRREIYR